MNSSQLTMNITETELHEQFIQPLVLADINCHRNRELYFTSYLSYATEITNSNKYHCNEFMFQRFLEWSRIITMFFSAWIGTSAFKTINNVNITIIYW